MAKSYAFSLKPAASLAAILVVVVFAGTPTHRENNFNFAQPPSVFRSGSDYIISFATQGYCDATVSIVDTSGKVVRHLASGVLGSNAPYPFTQNLHSQNLIWDGLDDQGRPAPAGSRVHVGLGLKATYSNNVYNNPLNLYSYGIGCDKDGNAYVLTLSNEISAIYVFSREGKYLRQILPVPGGLAKTDYSSAYEVVGPDSSPIYLSKNLLMLKGGNETIVRRTDVAISASGRLIFTNDGSRVRKFFRLLDLNGGNASIGSQLGPWQMAAGATSLAFTKGEQSLYATHEGIGMSMPGPLHCVMRFGLNDSIPSGWSNTHNWGDYQPFLGNRDSAGSDNAHFNIPKGIATDTAGNLYVCDFGNNRVQVFSADAAYLRTIAIVRPSQVRVNHTTGAIYVLSTDLIAMGTAKTPNSSRIVKFSAEGDSLGAFTFPGCNTGNVGWTTHFTLDDSRDTAILWIGNPEELWSSGKGIWRISECNNVFQKLGDITQYDSYDPFIEPNTQYLSVDIADKWLYVKNRRIKASRSNVARFDTHSGAQDVSLWTGKPAWPTPDDLDEFCPGPDGFLYARNYNVSATGGPEYIWRINPETGVRIPFTGENCDSGRIVITGYHSPKFHRDGIDVAPNGDVYVIQHHSPSTLPGPVDFLLESWRPSPSGFGPLFLHRFTNDGRLVRSDILPGIIAGPGGVRVGRSGSIYIPMNMTQGTFSQVVSDVLGQTISPLASSFTPTGNYQYGTLCKFDADSGKLMLNATGAWKGYGNQKCAISGLMATFEGVGPLHPQGCVCYRCRISLDGFERIFAPLYQLAGVMALDQNLNRIACLGSFGGPIPKDSLVTKSFGLRQPAYLSVNDKALYVADVGNRTVVRASLGYYSEAFLELNGTAVTGASGNPLSDVCRLLPNTPNPYNPATMISYYLPAKSNVTLTVFDSKGRMVVKLTEMEHSQGSHQILFKADNLASGVYVYEMKAGTFVARRNMVLLR